MFPAFHKTRMLTPTPGERMTDRPAVVFLLFFAILLISFPLQSLIATLALLCLPGEPSPKAGLLCQLFATTAMVAAVLLWCRLGERRSFMSLGFVRRGAIVEYLTGLAGGLFLFGAAVLLCVLTGAATVNLLPRAQMPSIRWILLFFAGYIIQGMSEELLCRAYLMVSLSRQWPLTACAVINALLFSILHLGNAGVSALALLNIFLFGLLASVLTLRRGSIWMVGALHSMWNFVQGNLFGIPVSGHTGTPAPLVTHLYGDTPGQILLNGGAFGLEGGLSVTVVLILGLTIVLLIPTKKSEIMAG